MSEAVDDPRDTLYPPSPCSRGAYVKAAWVGEGERELGADFTSF